MPAKILLIEDEKEIADTLQYAFSSAGMEPSWVATGGDAQLELKQHQFDFCVLDIGLPDCDGLELLKTIRAETGPNQAIPVMFLTARSEEIDRIVGLEIGADDYVCKPFSPREVVARSKAIMKRASLPPVSAAPALSNANAEFSINHQNFTISYRDQALNLTRSEYTLMAALLAQPGRVFSRRQLLDKVFSSNHPSDDRAIDTHIKTLRAKLKAHNPHTDFIITHRGFGYSLELDN